MKTEKTTTKTTKRTTKKTAKRSTGIAARGGIRILFATDGSAGAAGALDLLASLPLRAVDEVTVVTYPSYFLVARPDGTGLIGRLMEGRRRVARTTVDEAVRRLAGRDVRASGVVAQGFEAVDGILRVVTERSPDLLVMGSRGLGPVSSLVIGSTARTLALLSPVPVLIVRDRQTAPQRVLVAVDGSGASRAALAAFAQLPLPGKVEVELLHVLPAHDWSGLPVRGEELAALREEQGSPRPPTRCSGHRRPRWGTASRSGRRRNAERSRTRSGRTPTRWMPISSFSDRGASADHAGPSGAPPPSA